ncbi:MAG: hypothetical protein M1818_000911 [Claussenomyces sp. TS43310]|nr:MAG: hypothetical protein M1818_000911 [Claussenomyces sp. TS43310]
MAGFAALGRSQSTISIPVPTSVPSDASQAVDHSFLGFGVETASWPDYAGNLTSPNLFSRNLVESLTNKTGKGTIIRVGGTSGDHATYVSSQVEAVIRPPSQVGLNVPWGITIGSTYFEGYSNFPGNKYTVMVPMAPVKNGNLTNSIDQTQAAIAGMGGLSSLESLELGNEPNAYPGVDRPSDYSPANYSTEWLQYTPELISALGLPEGPTQQALAIGSDAPAEWNV